MNTIIKESGSYITLPIKMLGSLAIFIIVLALITEKVFLGEQILSLTPALPYAAILLAICSLTSIISKSNLIFDARASICLSILFCFSEVASRPYSFLNSQNYYGEVLLLFIVLLLLRNYLNSLLLVLAVTTPLLFSYWILERTAEGIIFTDDHATFLYRLLMLRDNFPYIPFYNPLWNSGIDERYFFATGTLNIFFLTAPLTYFFDLWKHYTLVPLFILAVLVPGCSFLACKVLNLSTRTGLIASLLAVTSSLGWYQWGLHFGPLGFLTTCALSPLLAAYAIKFLDTESELSLFEACLIIGIATLVLFWSPGGLIFLPAILLGLVRLKPLLKKSLVPFVLAGLIIINTPWILVFWSASSVSSFLQKEDDIKIVHNTGNSKKSDFIKEEKPPTSMFLEHLNVSKKLLNENFQTANPLLLFLAIPALLVLLPQQRVFYFLMTLWLVTLGAIVAPFKPQLELDRMLIVLLLLLCVPIANFLDSFLKRSTTVDRIVQAGVVAILCFSILRLGSIAKERTEVKYAKSDSFVDQISKELDKYQSYGRVLFSGFVLHDFMGGHLAPLSTKTKTPLIASSQVHKHWKYKDVIPSEFLGAGASKIEEYFTLMNVAAVVSTDRTWRSYFKEHPELYKQVWQHKNYFLFERIQFEPSYFYDGDGEVLEQNSHQVVLEAKSPYLILKFAYFPFLRSSACSIKAHRISKSIEFIKLVNCPLGEKIIIDSKPAYARVFS